MAPPRQSYFCLLVWDGCHVVGTTCNDHLSFHVVRTTCNDCLSLNLGGWGSYKPCSSSMVKSWRRSRGLATWEIQRICILLYLNPGALLSNNTWMVMHFFIYIAVKSHRKIPKVKNFQFSSFLSEKNVCSIVPAGQYFSNLKDKQFKSHRSVPKSTLHVTTSG